MSLLLAGALKVTVILIIGLLAATRLRRRSAAVRHWVLLVAVVCAAALPLVERVAPSWHVALSTGSFDAQADPTGDSTVAIDRPRDAADAASEESSLSALSPPAGWQPGAMAPSLIAVWVAGAGIGLAVLLAGFGRLAWLASGCKRVVDGRATVVLAELTSAYGLRRPVVVLQSSHPTLLVAWGLTRPRIMLPAGAADWPEDRLRVVLAHELAHVRRGDWPGQLVAELLKCAYWFNPLVWLVCRRLREESECACDDAVLSRGVEGTEYAAHVLDLARVLRPHDHVWSMAHGMARGSGLERRFRAMLNTHLDRRPTTRAARAATAVALLSVTIPVAGFVAAQSFATFSGHIFDSTNRILPGARLVLTNEESEAKYEVRADESGRFEFVGLPPGDYLLGSRTPGFQERVGRLTMAGRDVNEDVTLQVGSIEETVTVTAGAAPRAIVDRSAGKRDASGCNHDSPIGGVIRPPRKVRDVAPRYPEHLRDTGMTGVVVLDGRIGTDGFFSELRVVSAPHPDLATAAVEAVRQWEYDWTLLNCVPVEVPMNVTVNFRSPPLQ